MKPLRPLKADNKPLVGATVLEKLSTLKFPLYVSFKLDGFRCIINQANVITSSGKPFNNIHINNLLKPIAEYTKFKKLLLDGELLSHSTPFNEFSGIFRSDEMILPNDTYFYCFDKVFEEHYEFVFHTRIAGISYIAQQFPSMRVVQQVFCYNPEEVIPIYERAIAWGCDGVMLRNPNGKYKLGRATFKENIIHKLKPWETFDAKIIRIEQATEVNPNAEKTVNELGYSETSSKKCDRILIEKAKTFVVLHEGKELSVVIKGTDAEKEEIWKNQNDYIGKFVEYKGLVIGSKELPRHPTSIRMRYDKG